MREIWLDFEEANAIPVMDKAVEMAQESLRLTNSAMKRGGLNEC